MEEHHPEIRALTREEIMVAMDELGEKAFRGKQIYHWIQSAGVQSWDEMRNLPGELRAKLAGYFALQPLHLLLEQVSKDGTRKYLWELPDGNRIESVLLFHEGDFTRKHTTLCISTQVGCPMGCGFCATGKLGFIRNLSAGEIVSQVLDCVNLWPGEAFKINNLVYMGMGEPLLNLPAVVKSIKLLNHKDGQNIGMRRITVSTCGLVPQIQQLAAENLDLVLAVSLHAPNNALRNQIMPVNRTYPLEELLEACRDYICQTGRRITFEYALIKGFNDGVERARELAGLLKGLKANLNIIPVNNTSGSEYQKPLDEQIKKFLRTLKQEGIEAVIREEKGSDIAAACGQLAGTMKVR